MASLWSDIRKHVVSLAPYPFRKRRLNFISIHYLYLIAMAILGSVIVKGAGHIHYIDALFFASGAATQSGLNTLDLNTVNTGQQFVLFFLAMVCNPIFIHSSVVFIRLYWFEKRFQHIVKEAKSFRRTKSRSRTDTMGRENNRDYNNEERGVNGRNIEVLHHSPVGSPKVDASGNEGSTPSLKNGENSDSETGTPNGQSHLPPRASDEDVRAPRQLSAEQHIAFLENQRNPRGSNALRIPSPREFDRGGRPEEVENDDWEGVVQSTMTPAEPQGFQNIDVALDQAPPPPLRSRITIDEPNITRVRNKTNTFPHVGSRTATDDGSADGPKRAGVKRHGTFSSMLRSNTTQEKEEMPYLSWEPTIGRNSMFVNLTEEQREELGGIEYRALKTLALVLVTYFFAFHILGIICLTPWIYHTSYGEIVRKDGVGRTWWGIFTAASAFNDLGFTLTPDSMNSFSHAVFPLLLWTFLIIIGNTGFPCMLRFVIWLSCKVVPNGSGIWEELRFLLDHPRRCFTLLFPSSATWWLTAILVVLNGLDLIFFVVLDLNDSTVTSLPPGLRLVDGLFQASSTRTAGFSVVSLADLHPAIQVSYLIMMYISVFPIAISMRRTNVYEEKSLGIYSSQDEEEDDNGKEPSYVGAHLRRQLSFDLWYVFMGLFIIAISEGPRLQNTNEYAFTLFSVLFEIVSAYGTVGLSLGYPNINASFSAEFNVVSKLVIIAMQIRGRHRGLPYEVDRAILLPSESLTKKEAKEAEKRAMRRRGSNLSQMSAVSGYAPPGNFRTETGLTTGSFMNGRTENGGPGTLRHSVSTNNASRERRGTQNTLHSRESHVSHGNPKMGLGNMMFSLAGKEDALEREKSRKE